jgi:hypothetical protein
MATEIRAIRWSSRARVGGLPLVDLAVGPDLAQGEWRGYAKGIIAVGDVAQGVVALAPAVTPGPGPIASR